KYVKLRGGRRGVLLIALGLTDHGVRAVLDVVPTREEDVVSYWDLPVRLWRRYNLTLVVADGVKALDTAISRSGIKVARQTCLVHLKRRVDRRVRVLLDLLLSLAESVPTRGSPLLPPRPQGALAPPQVEQPGRVLQLPPGEEEVREVPLSLEDTPDRPGHSPQLQPLDLLSRSCNNITRFLISS
ncbi:transposase, partial [Metallosphaera yellowstonensis MK1]